MTTPAKICGKVVHLADYPGRDYALCLGPPSSCDHTWPTLQCTEAQFKEIVTSEYDRSTAMGLVDVPSSKEFTV